MPAGQTPHTVTLFAYGSLVESVQPGDRVNVTGIFRAKAVRVNPRTRNTSAVYRTNIDVFHFNKVDKKKLRIAEKYFTVFALNNNMASDFICWIDGIRQVSC